MPLCPALHVVRLTTNLPPRAVAMALQCCAAVAPPVPTPRLADLAGSGLKGSSQHWISSRCSTVDAVKRRDRGGACGYSSQARANWRGPLADGFQPAQPSLTFGPSLGGPPRNCDRPSLGRSAGPPWQNSGSSGPLSWDSSGSGRRLHRLAPQKSACLIPWPLIAGRLSSVGEHLGLLRLPERARSSKATLGQRGVAELGLPPRPHASVDGEVVPPRAKRGQVGQAELGRSPGDGVRGGEAGREKGHLQAAEELEASNAKCRENESRDRLASTGSEAAQAKKVSPETQQSSGAELGPETGHLLGMESGVEGGGRAVAIEVKAASQGAVAGGGQAGAEWEAGVIRGGDCGASNLDIPEIRRSVLTQAERVPNGGAKGGLQGQETPVGYLWSDLPPLMGQAREAATNVGQVPAPQWPDAPAEPLAATGRALQKRTNAEGAGSGDSRAVGLERASASTNRSGGNCETRSHPDSSDSSTVALGQTGAPPYGRASAGGPRPTNGTATPGPLLGTGGLSADDGVQTPAASEDLPAGTSSDQLANGALPGGSVASHGPRAGRGRREGDGRSSSRAGEVEGEGAHTAMAYLKELRIRDFVLIESQTTCFGPGLNVITGESGAGKSILLGALTQVLGAPLAEDCVRQPASSALLQGLFWAAPETLPALSEALAAHAPPAVSSLTQGALVPRGAREYREVLLEREILRGGAAGAGEGANGGSPGKGGKGKSVCRINGTAVPLRALRSVGALLVDVNGQNSQGALRTEAAQLALLDHQAGATAKRDHFAELAQQARSLWEERAEIGDGGCEEEEALQELVDEVAALGVEEGEVEGLKGELRLQEKAQLAAEKCSCVHSMMAEGGPGGRGIHGSLRALRRELKEVEDAAVQVAEAEWSAEGSLLGGSGRIADALEMVAEAEGLLYQAGSLVEDFAAEISFSERRILEIKQRIRQIDVLRRKHDARTPEDLLRLAEAAADRLANLVDVEVRQEEVRAGLVAVAGQMAALGVDLSRQRRIAAERIRGEVEGALQGLGMEHSRFHCDVSWERGVPSSAELAASGTALAGPSSPWGDRAAANDDEQEDEDEDDDAGGQAGDAEEEPARQLLANENLLRAPQAAEVGELSEMYHRYTETGLDKVVFKLAANAGEPLLPLSHVASGGECARVMLALKTVAGAAEGDVPVAVFDEVDSGVGGRIGGRVGSTLKKLGSTGHQVLCVTHLPQVAVHADTHIKVLKEVGPDGRMQTRTRSLESRQQRAEEIAHMLGLGVPAALELFAHASEGGAADLPRSDGRSKRETSLNEAQPKDVDSYQQTFASLTTSIRGLLKDKPA